jgi:hypothetical protein
MLNFAGAMFAECVNPRMSTRFNRDAMEKNLLAQSAINPEVLAPRMEGPAYISVMIKAYEAAISVHVMANGEGFADTDHYHFRIGAMAVGGISPEKLQADIEDATGVRIGIDALSEMVEGFHRPKTKMSAANRGRGGHLRLVR